MEYVRIYREIHSDQYYVFRLRRVFRAGYAYGLGTRHDVKQFIFNRLGTYHGTELPTGPGTMEFVGCGLFGILRSSGIRFRHFRVTVGVGARSSVVSTFESRPGRRPGRSFGCQSPVCLCCICGVGVVCLACVALRCPALPCARFVCSGGAELTVIG